ncbi:uncharacterized protein M437DRAFT_64975 [Aureobasidium melanogenum CBS 110374]|uniref:Uncharacterized protein n=1 Tax=Aureobasidium melanogenum (strain CBS 110374) TaxID=1043003 RepID=A0A074W3C8_AURM1|nr:uncharacterized protein M437DRAFT_64975 [Aureobasidium melanogenum CBS 110374]KEQ64437.1 hypothetical protein M437DRAFT_64975 [Aureobasidium melanogenum CBS 110374]
MPSTQTEERCTTRRTPPIRSDSLKSRYSAPHSQTPERSSSSDLTRRASDTTTCLPRSSSPVITPWPPAKSPAVKPANSTPALKPLPTLKLASPKPSPAFKSPTTTKPLPAVAQSPLPIARLECIALPGKYSPTQIPTPKFVISKRKTWSLLADTKGRNGSDGVEPTTPERLVIKRRASTPRTPRRTPNPSPSPLFQQEFDNVEETAADTNTLCNPNIIIKTPASGDVVGAPIFVPPASENSGVMMKGQEQVRPKGLGLRFPGGLEDGVCVSVSSMTRIVDTTDVVDTFGCSSSSSSSREAENLNTEDKQEKRDFLSPIQDFAAKVVISPFSVSPQKHLTRPYHHYLSLPDPLPLPLPPSPSHTHPYTSGIHILPSCTSGSLTHRLACGHLILTSSPELCAHNCVAQKTTFESARLQAQGFGANVRGLDQRWWCGVCAEVGREEGRKCVGVLGRDMLGSGSHDGEVCR